MECVDVSQIHLMLEYKESFMLEKYYLFKFYFDMILLGFGAILILGTLIYIIVSCIQDVKKK